MPRMLVTELQRISHSTLDDRAQVTELLRASHSTLSGCVSRGHVTELLRSFSIPDRSVLPTPRGLVTEPLRA